MKRILVWFACLTLFASLALPASAGGACHAPDQVVARERGTLVRYVNVCTTPTVLEIQAGETVRWRNDDGTEHTVTSGSGFWADERLDPSGDTFTHTFKEEGTFPYYCMLHPEMGGVIQVGPSPGPIAVAAIRRATTPVRSSVPWSVLAAIAVAATLVGFGLGRRTARS